MKRLGSLSGRVFIVALLVLVLPLVLQSSFLIVELSRAWQKSQFDRLIQVSNERLGLARSWVADRELFTTTIDAQGTSLTTAEVASITPGAQWVAISQEGPILVAQDLQSRELRVVASERQAYLIQDQILFIPNRRPITRGLLVPKRALEQQLMTNAPSFPLEVRADITDWQSAQQNGDQVWSREDTRNTQMASGSLVPGTNFFVLTIEPQEQELPVSFRESGWRLAAGIAMTILLGMALSGWAVRRLTRPLVRLQDAMQKVGLGDWSQRLTLDPWAFELNALARGFNSMLDNLQSASAQVQQEQSQRLVLEAELNLGRQVQRALLPRRESRTPGLEVASWYQSARETGGDFYDYFGQPARDGRPGALHLCIADVAGKGLSACLFSLTFRALLRAFSQTRFDLEQTARSANRLLCWDTNESSTFVTAWVGELAEDGRLDYVCAGHPMAIVRRKQGGIETLSAPGMAFGVDRDYPYTSASALLAPDDLLLLYTDGLVDQTNPQGAFYGEERLHALLKMLDPQLSPEDLLLRIRQDVATFAEAAPQHDDLTLLAIRKR
jgi:serine phosphatase RsbU (regulator of sigma subunit)